MFNKRLIILLLAASVMASCDRNDIPVPADPEVVGFDGYVSRGVTTKAGWGGTLDTDALKNAGKADGFGVFAYYGNGALYN